MPSTQTVIVGRLSPKGTSSCHLAWLGLNFWEGTQDSALRFPTVGNERGSTLQWKPPNVFVRSRCLISRSSSHFYCLPPLTGWHTDLHQRQQCVQRLPKGPGEDTGSTGPGWLASHWRHWSLASSGYFSITSISAVGLGRIIYLLQEG